MANRKTSLQDYYSGQYDVPVLLLSSGILLLIGLSLPLLTVEKSVFWRHWKNTYSVMTGVVSLAEQGDYLLAAVIFFFSIVFPVVKLTALWFLWVGKLADEQRHRVLYWLGMLGKWSMLDVFVVAITVVAAKLKTLTNVEPKVGVYLFGLSIALAMITTMRVEHLARRSRLV